MTTRQYTKENKKKNVSALREHHKVWLTHKDGRAEKSNGQHIQMALFLWQLRPQNRQKPNYETHHPPYGTFVQREATRMTLMKLFFAFVENIFINYYI
jgi:hypothetical protein